MKSQQAKTKSSLPPSKGQPASASEVKRDGYTLGLGFSAVIVGTLMVLFGLSRFIPGAGLDPVGPGSSLGNYQLWTHITQQLDAIILLLAGALAVYHGGRALARHNSKPIIIPSFWFALVIYTILAILYAFLVPVPTTRQALDAIPFPLAAFRIIVGSLQLLIGAIGLFLLAATILQVQKELTWRRVTMAFICGACVSTLIEMILRFLSVGMQTPSLNPTETEGVAIMGNLVTTFLGFLLCPTILIVMIWRVRSQVEIWLLGLACGVGFVMVSGYSATIMNNIVPEWGNAIHAIDLRSLSQHDMIRRGWEMPLLGLVPVFSSCLGFAFSIIGWYHLLNQKARHIGKTLLYWLPAAVLIVVARLIAQNGERLGADVSILVPAGCMLLLLVIMLTSLFLHRPPKFLSHKPQ